MSVFDQPSTRN